MPKRFLLFVCLLWSPMVLSQGWDVVAAPDESYRSRWVAEVKNAEGHTLRIYRRIQHINFQAFAEITLAGGKRFGSVLPLLSIDGSEPRPIERPEEKTATIKSNQVSWRVWASTTAELLPTDALTPWIHGSEIAFSFPDDNGRQQTVRFALSGSGDAIRRIVSGTYK